MIEVTPTICIHDAELQFSFIASPGPGGQNVNKVATAVQLRFDAKNSPSLNEDVRMRLMVLAGNKMTTQGELIIKASRHRTQERNKQDALSRLIDLIKLAATPPRKRKKTKPTRASKERRLSKKKQHAAKKFSRQIKRNFEG